MHLKIFGFSFDKRNAPAAISPADLFQSLASTPSLKSDIKLRHGLVPVPVLKPDGTNESWWAGILLKVRDSKAFTKLTENGGQQILTTEMLRDHETLVEANFFIANPRTGAGLFAHHHQSVPLVGGLFQILLTEFKSLRDEKRTQISEDESLTPAERRERYKELAGGLWPEQIVHPQHFKELVGSMKKVQTVTVRMSSVTTARRLFRGCSFVPVKESHEYKIPKGALSEEIADCLDHALGTPDVAAVKVSGKDRHDRDTTISNEKNRFVFDQVDYDTMMQGFVLNIDDYVRTLFTSKVVKHLVALTKGRTIWQLLERS